VAKRAFDFVVSLVGLIILTPLFLFLAILIKLDSRGPVFYKASRVGQGGRTFGMYKFRTMRDDADQMGGGPSCADNDCRITRMGTFLRRFKLNELPQLINVLKGDMSFVGPRPEVQLYVDMFTEEEKSILSVRPGITDWACIWNSDEGKVLAEASRNGQDPEQYYMENLRPKKIALQLDYVRNHSFWVDLKILLKTAVVFFK